MWPHLEAAAEVRLAVTGDYAYVPTYWRAKAGGPDEDGVPTSYYASVQLVCRPTVVDDPQGKAQVLAAAARRHAAGGRACRGRDRRLIYKTVGWRKHVKERDRIRAGTVPAQRSA